MQLKAETVNSIMSLTYKLYLLFTGHIWLIPLDSLGKLCKVLYPAVYVIPNCKINTCYVYIFYKLLMDKLTTEECLFCTIPQHKNNTNRQTENVNAM